jgi:hypothetical protein
MRWRGFCDGYRVRQGLKPLYLAKVLSGLKARPTRQAYLVGFCGERSERPAPSKSWRVRHPEAHLPFALISKSPRFQSPVISGR